MAEPLPSTDNRADAASQALSNAAQQLRADIEARRRDRQLVDVLAVDLLAMADWLDRRAWLLSVSSDALDVPGFDRTDVGADDELLAADGAPPFLAQS